MSLIDDFVNSLSLPFHEVQFPVGISWGAKGGPGYKTVVTELGSGWEKRESNWLAQRGEYEVSHTIKSPEDVEAILTFFYCRRGRAHGFRFKDWGDYQADHDPVVEIPGGLFQLARYYADPVNPYTRAITKPCAGGVADDSGYVPPVPILYDSTGSPLTLGGTASHAILTGSDTAYQSDSGSGYAVGDTGTIGTGGATYEVTSVSSGSLLNYEIDQVSGTNPYLHIYLSVPISSEDLATLAEGFYVYGVTFEGVTTESWMNTWANAQLVAAANNGPGGVGHITVWHQYSSITLHSETGTAHVVVELPGSVTDFDITSGGINYTQYTRYGTTPGGSQPGSGSGLIIEALTIDETVGGDYELDTTTGIVTALHSLSTPLTWSGEFDIPARFDVDLCQFEQMAYDDANWSNIQIIELRRLLPLTSTPGGIRVVNATKAAQSGNDPHVDIPITSPGNALIVLFAGLGTSSAPMEVLGIEDGAPGSYGGSSVDTFVQASGAAASASGTVIPAISLAPSGICRFYQLDGKTGAPWLLNYPGDPGGSASRGQLPNVLASYTLASNQCVMFNPYPAGVLAGFTNELGYNILPMALAGVRPDGSWDGTMHVPWTPGNVGDWVQANWNMVFSGSIVVTAAGTYTFSVSHNDAAIVGMGNGAVRVSGPMVQPANFTMTKTALSGYDLMMANNLDKGEHDTGSFISNFVVTFPTAGTYPVEIDYACHVDARTLSFSWMNGPVLQPVGPQGSGYTVNGGTDIWYALNSPGGIGRVRVTPSEQGDFIAWVLEVEGLTAFDLADSADDQTPSTGLVAPVIAGTGTTELAVAAQFSEGIVQLITPLEWTWLGSNTKSGNGSGAAGAVVYAPGAITLQIFSTQVLNGTLFIFTDDPIPAGQLAILPGLSAGLSGLTTETWLNGKSVRILTASNPWPPPHQPIRGRLTAQTTHANYAATEDTGAVSTGDSVQPPTFHQTIPAGGCVSIAAFK